jgi:hypothetical protein
MPVTLNASTSSGFAATADNSGVLTLQSNGTDAASVSGSNFQFNSGYGSVATAYGCRAWVNFNGTGTVAIRGSGNVTSITDNGTGDYTVNFTTAMPDANYAVIGSSGGQNGTSNGAIYQYDQATAKTTSLCRILLLTSAGAAIDTPQIAVSVFR